MNQELITFPLALSLILFTCFYTGKLFSKLGIPRVISEIFAGLLLGPAIWGSISPYLHQNIFNPSNIQFLQYAKEIGLIMLMFFSGLELKSVNIQKNIKSTLIGIFLGIGIPVLFGLLTLSQLNINELAGPQNDSTRILITLILSMAVTSIPVISRILIDLELFHTQFAKMLLSIALIEDVILYSVLNLILKPGHFEFTFTAILIHFIISTLFIIFAVVFKHQIYQLLRGLSLGSSKMDTIQYQTLILATLFLIIYLTSLLGIVPMLSAFACGLIVGSAASEKSLEAVEYVSKFSFATFVPIYFVMIGFKLNLQEDFSLFWLLFFFISSSLAKVLGGYLTGYLSKYSKLESILLGLSLNARGGPGIIIAATTFEAGIINSVSFTTLILTSLFTSLLAGVFLKKYRDVVS